MNTETITPGTPAWAPHGTRGWTAVRIVELLPERRALVGLVLPDGRPSHASRRVVPLDWLFPRVRGQAFHGRPTLRPVELLGPEVRRSEPRRRRGQPAGA